MFNVNQPSPFIVTETATGLSVGGVDLTASQAVSIVAAFRKAGSIIQGCASARTFSPGGVSYFTFRSRSRC